MEKLMDKPCPARLKQQTERITLQVRENEFDAARAIRILL
jgi:hypothetical protein